LNTVTVVICLGKSRFGWFLGKHVLRNCSIKIKVIFFESFANREQRKTIISKYHQGEWETLVFIASGEGQR